MNQRWRYRSWKLGLVTCLAASGILVERFTNLPLFENSVLAQVTPDPSLGTQVNQNGATFRITGGTAVGRPNGILNVFHSFSSFSIPSGGSAEFLNAANVTNILARVTGPASVIEGLIRSQGKANLFLMNPNGIIFGPNAQLDVRGSFVATTANAIQFGNNGSFSSTSPQADLPLLTVNPSAFLFNQIAARPIINRSRASSTGLQVDQGRSLLLIGGDVDLEGGQLFALGGRIELGGVTGFSVVGLDIDGNNLSLNFPADVQRSDVHLSQGAEVNVRSNNGGSIAVNAQNVSLDSGSIFRAGIIENQGSNNSQAGNVDINATQTITLTDNSFIANSIRPNARGKPGNINITTGSLVATTGAELFTSTSGRGNAGNITIRARDRVSFDGIGTLNRSTRSTGVLAEVERNAVGQGGNIDITANLVEITNGAGLTINTRGNGSGGTLKVTASEIRVRGASTKAPPDADRFSGITAETRSIGNAGNLIINAGKLIIEDGGQVSTGTASTGRGGTLSINATDSVVVRGAASEVESDRDASNLSRVSSRTDAGGDAGDLMINTQKLLIAEGAQVAAGNNFVFGLPHTGNGGKLTVNASESVTVSGDSPDGENFSRLTVRTEGSGNAQALTINTKKLIIENGAQVSSGTFDQGRGGPLIVNATDLVEVRGASRNGILSRLGTRTEGAGDASTLTISTNDLIVRDGAQIDVRSFSKGAAGNLEVNARSIQLDNKGQLTAESISGSGGDLILRVQDLLLLRHNSRISTTAGTARTVGNGGNIFINAPNGFIVSAPFENSDITANAFTGQGGRVTINSQGIFWLTPRSRADLESLLGTNDPVQLDPSKLQTNDITAISQVNPLLSGQVTITTPDIDPNRGLVALPSNLDDPSRKIPQGCSNQGRQAGSRFVITGRGGLPINPGEALTSDAVQVDLVTRNPEVGNPSNVKVSNPVDASSQASIVEAQGWVIDDAGGVELVALASTAAPHSSWQSEFSCGAPEE